jgi:hypothetical protein
VMGLWAAVAGLTALFAMFLYPVAEVGLRPPSQYEKASACNSALVLSDPTVG